MRLFKITFLALVLSIAVLGWAQGPRAAGAGMRALQRLNLTEQQRTEVRGILQQQRAQVQGVRQDASLSDAQKHDKIQQIRQDTHAQIQAVLTPEQQAQFKNLRAARRGLARLNLTADQRAKMRPIQQQMRQQVRAVHQDASLTPEQKRERIRAIRQDAMAQMRGILTPEQQQQLEHMRQWHGGKGGPPPAPEGF